MLEVLANIELKGRRHALCLISQVTDSCPKGSTLGSRAELKDATAFMAKHRIAPVVSHVVHGLDRAEEGFELLASGKHFGKVVIRVADNRANKL